ncbi:MAG: pyruvate ferredoxin oxidoreductase [Candidatus Bathyarchaeota archaeon]|nr:MAG: pyruvate ferredoxin oxidoreductase [Candidatus Bathyarchaeota archaeon]
MSQITLREAAKKPDGLAQGHRLCAGCGESLIVRMVLKATRGPAIITSATGCMEVATSIFPYTSWNLPWIHTAFENAAANASGIEAAWKAMRKKGKGPLAEYETLDIIAFAGDGGTYDIGLQALSGALERGHDFTYVLLDNEAYMNTGIQRSGGTPFAAATTTSPAGKVIPGKREWKKPIDDIVIAHGIPYVATLNAAWPLDVMRKSRTALEADGPTFLHAIVPCTRGWRYPTNKTIEISRLATQTCLFPLYECRLEEGRPVYELSAPSAAIARRPEAKKPVVEYLEPQGRFRHLFRPERRDDLIDRIQAWVDHNWTMLLEKAGV